LTDQQKQEAVKQLKEFARRLFDTVRTIWNAVKEAARMIYRRVMRQKAEEGDQEAQKIVARWDLEKIEAALRETQQLVRVTRHSRKKKGHEARLKRLENRKAEILEGIWRK
jgi:predicted transcriptional regulator